MNQSAQSPRMNRINRIRLEFKGRTDLRRVTGRTVLIESDWNLKATTQEYKPTTTAY